MICFYCEAEIKDEHLCNELAESRKAHRLLHDDKTIKFWVAKVKQEREKLEPNGS